MKTLGILGGIGPESTGRFYLELVEKFQRAFAPKSNDGYPHIIVNSISAPDLIDVSDASALAAYRKGLRQLEAWGAELIVIACNSAHCFIGELRQATRVPIVDARTATERAVRRSGAESILVLASPTTIRNGLYRFAFATEKMLGNEEIARVGAAIRDYNVGRRDTAEQRQVVELAREAVRDGYSVIGGCTEIHAILTNAGVAHVDPMQEAMEDILNWWRAQPFETSE